MHIWDVDCDAPNRYVAEVEGKLIASSGYYKCEDSTIGFLGVTISDKTSDKALRDQAIKALIDHIFADAENRGMRFLSFFTDSEQMVERLEKDHGMFVTDRGDAYILCKALNGNKVTYLDD